jgi:hypothetical protein
MASANVLKKQSGCCCGSMASEDRARAGEHAHIRPLHMHGQHGDTRSTDAGHDVVDPVCGMMVDPHNTPYWQRYAGQSIISALPNA